MSLVDRLTTTPQLTGATNGAMTIATPNIDILLPRTSLTKMTALLLGCTVCGGADDSPAKARAMQNVSYVGESAIQITIGIKMAEPMR